VLFRLNETLSTSVANVSPMAALFAAALGENSGGLSGWRTAWTSVSLRNGEIIQCCPRVASPRSVERLAGFRSRIHCQMPIFPRSVTRRNDDIRTCATVALGSWTVMTRPFNAGAPLPSSMRSVNGSLSGQGSFPHETNASAPPAPGSPRKAAPRDMGSGR
jgi:hypothetical protein